MMRESTKQLLQGLVMILAGLIVMSFSLAYLYSKFEQPVEACCTCVCEEGQS